MACLLLNVIVFMDAVFHRGKSRCKEQQQTQELCVCRTASALQERPLNETPILPSKDTTNTHHPSCSKHHGSATQRGLPTCRRWMRASMAPSSSPIAVALSTLVALGSVSICTPCLGTKGSIYTLPAASPTCKCSLAGL